MNYFWYRTTLNITPDIEIGGSLQWWLVMCLATAWCVVYICFIRGIASIGKVSWPDEKLHEECQETNFLTIISGGVRDGHVSLPGFDHLPDPWPNLRWSHRWTVVSLHSKSELGTKLTQKDCNYRLSQTGMSSKHQIHICLHM